MSSLGVGGLSVANRVGNRAASASGVRSRLVLMVDWAGLVARSVAVFGPLVGFVGGGGFSSSAGSISLAESIMLSTCNYPLVFIIVFATVFASRRLRAFFLLCV